MAITMLDFVNSVIFEKPLLTKSEFKDIRNSGDESALEEAIAKMEEAGGYENLPD